MDKIAAQIAALGVPGLVLVVAMSATGFAGAAALTTALAALGGPFGMIGGLAALGVLLLLSKALTEHGFEAIYKAVITELHRKGVSDEDILRQIKTYPISRELKLKLKQCIANYGNETAAR